MNIKQGFDFLLPIIKNFKNKKNVLWLFGGTGPLKENFMSLTKDIPNIMFLPFQEPDNMNSWLNTGDIHIIPQSVEVEDLLFPSKLLSILASGNPIVSNANKKSELGQLIEVAGKRTDPKDKNGFIESLNLLINDENLRIKFGKKAREIAENKFSKEKVLKEFETLLINRNKIFNS